MHLIHTIKKVVDTYIPAHTSSWSVERKRKYATYIESQAALGQENNLAKEGIEGDLCMSPSSTIRDK